MTVILCCHRVKDKPMLSDVSCLWTPCQMKSCDWLPDRSGCLTTCPLDPISSSLLQTISRDLPFLSSLINSSLTTGSVPSDFKMARVSSLLKKPTLDSSDVKNYRPVSLLSFLSKTLEGVVSDQLSRYLSQNNLLDPNQLGFKTGQSTETTVLCVTEALSTSKADSLSSVLILLDLSAAFNTVNHHILLSTLSGLGVSGAAHSWIASYLAGRSYQVATHTSGCLADISTWMSAHHLKLNFDKTELLFLPGKTCALLHLTLPLVHTPERITHRIMESAGAGNPVRGVEERVQEHSAMLHHLGAMMDRVVQTMDHWERQEVSPVPRPAQPGLPLPVPSGTSPSGMRLSLPREYDGTAAQCQGFLLQLDLYLATWRGRECLPSSHASRGELWSGQTPCGEKETRRWTTSGSSPVASGPSLTIHPKVERRGNGSFIWGRGRGARWNSPWNSGPWPPEQAGTTGPSSTTIGAACVRTSDVSWPAGMPPSPSTNWWICPSVWITCWSPADVQRGLCRCHLQSTPLRCPWSWEGLRVRRLEEEPSCAPSVAADGTLLVGAVSVPLGVEATGRALWRHPR
ncbi:unnamed protein product [Oncorhynchus mykiss]|uniref:Reverse transcriptase domain-containing protein n=1 Tax=Oncorhynchus mykiss TaxID=8022 RepID=A0A060XP68_ONCMY|nr:unnamed protein product [Oncorhynchus mykiss]